MLIGILGGTFDPIHNSHIEIALEAKKQFHLDKVWMMPTPYPPHKDKNAITSNFHRINMIKEAVKDVEGVEYSDIEISRQGETYTADTLYLLKELYPEDEFYFIMGSDSIAYFMNWYRPDVIVKYAKLLVVKRDDESSQKMADKIQEIQEHFQIEIGQIQMKASSISSSFIRTAPYSDIQNMIPKGVYDYIVKNNLYNNCNVNKAWSVNKITDDLKVLLKESRFEHTLGVATTAKKMAETFGVNPNQAYMAGILHDCAKHLSESELLRICKEHQLPITETEEKAPYLLHAKVGAFFAEHKYYITDSEILSAIEWHTTGKPAMTKLEQIIFCADYIEPNRTKQPRLADLRNLASKDLDGLTYEILKDTIDYLSERNPETIDGDTRKAYEYYKKLKETE